MDSSITFKEITLNDYSFLKEMLYDALFVLHGEEPFPRTILDTPAISKYVDTWNNSSGFGLIVQYNNECVGAVWGLIFSDGNVGYGFIDCNTPEITMAIKAGYRDRGFGEALLINFFERARTKGYKTLSLSVDKRNRAFSFYQKMGFNVVS